MISNTWQMGLNVNPSAVNCIGCQLYLCPTTTKGQHLAIWSGPRWTRVRNRCVSLSTEETLHFSFKFVSVQHCGHDWDWAVFDQKRTLVFGNEKTRVWCFGNSTTAATFRKSWNVGIIVLILLAVMLYICMNKILYFI